MKTIQINPEIKSEELSLMAKINNEFIIKFEECFMNGLILCIILEFCEVILLFIIFIILLMLNLNEGRRSRNANKRNKTNRQKF